LTAYSRKWFEDLLNEKNGLVHPSLWDDPFENFFLQCEVRDDSDNSIGSLHEISKNWYGQCWTKNRDSDAIWRIYNEQKNGVLVVTTIKKLFENFYDRSVPSAYLKYFIGEVQYQERIEIETFLAKTTFTDLALGGNRNRLLIHYVLKERRLIMRMRLGCCFMILMKHKVSIMSQAFILI